MFFKNIHWYSNGNLMQVEEKRPCMYEALGLISRIKESNECGLHKNNKNNNKNLKKVEGKNSMSTREIQAFWSLL